MKLVSIMMLLATFGPFAGQSPKPPPGFKSSPDGFQGTQTRIVSPTVVATWIKRVYPDRETLDLLVLWRGTPGWFLKGERRGSSGGATQTVVTEQVNYGGLGLQVEFDKQKLTAVVQRRVIDLKPNLNVLLVDRVDSSNVDLTIEPLSIEARVPSRDPQLELLLQRSSRIVEFLQCDVKLPVARDQRAAERVCQNIRAAKD